MLNLSINITSFTEKTEQSCLFTGYKNKMSHTMTPFKSNKKFKKSQQNLKSFQHKTKCQNC